MSNRKQSSDKVAAIASDVLRNPQSSGIAKSLAGSVISQTHTTRQTGAVMEDKASRVLSSDKYSDTTKTLAGSVLSQSNKKR